MYHAVTDAETAADLNRLTIKYAAKVGLLMREGVIKPEDAMPLQAPVNDAASRLVECLEGKPGAVDAAPAAAAVEVAFAALVALVKPHMKPKNSEALAALGAFYSGATYVAFVFNSPTCITERETILLSLHGFMSSRGGAGSRRRTLACAVSGCDLPRLKFRGASSSPTCRVDGEERCLRAAS